MMVTTQTAARMSCAGRCSTTSSAVRSLYDGHTQAALTRGGARHWFIGSLFRCFVIPFSSLPSDDIGPYSCEQVLHHRSLVQGLAVLLTDLLAASGAGASAK